MLCCTSVLSTSKIYLNCWCIWAQCHACIGCLNARVKIILNKKMISREAELNTLIILCVCGWGWLTRSYFGIVFLKSDAEKCHHIVYFSVTVIDDCRMFWQVNYSRRCLFTLLGLIWLSNCFGIKKDDSNSRCVINTEKTLPPSMQNVIIWLRNFDPWHHHINIM